MEKLKLFEMFAGYGGASFGLKKAGIEFECVGYSEIDKYAIQCWEQNHTTTTKNWGDCTKINPNELPNFDLLTGGFPCQDVSIAGNGDLSKGRTTLFNEIIRIAEVKQPRYMLLENVKGLLSKKHRAFYEHTITELNRIGYEIFMVYDKKHKENRVPILNSKDFGIPQNRERVWYICFRELDDLMRFKLPEKEELKIFVKDILEDNVDEKYYLSENLYNRLWENSRHRKSMLINKDISSTLCTRDYADGGKRVLVGDFRYDEGIRIRKEGISPTITRTSESGLSAKVFVISKKEIRRLTPTEYFRLMGFLDDNINLEGLSDTQRYKLAGNGWDINLVSKIFKEMFKSMFIKR